MYHPPAGQDVREGESGRDGGERLEVVDLLTAWGQPVEQPRRYRAPGFVPVVAVHDDDAKAAVAIGAVGRVGVYNRRRVVIVTPRATRQLEGRDRR